MKKDKTATIRTAREILALGPVYLDTETTGLGSNAQVVSIAILNYDGTELINTLVRPTAPIPVEATSVHGITDEDVSTAPTFADISPNLNSYSNRLIVIYNRDYDLRLCRQSAKAHGIEPWAPPETVCAMELYAKFYGEWNDHHKFYCWQKQSDAARRLGIDIPADLHRAAADANLCKLIIEAMAATPLPGETMPSPVMPNWKRIETAWSPGGLWSRWQDFQSKQQVHELAVNDIMDLLDIIKELEKQ